MKLIQIFALVAALATMGAAQSTNSQNSGSTSPSKTTGATKSSKTSQKSGPGTQTPPVQLMEPKHSQTTTGSKNSTSTSSSKAKPIKAKSTGSQTAAKTPAVVIRPVQPASSAKTASTATAKKTVPATKKTVATKAVSPKKTVVAKKNDQVKIVPQKTAENKKADSEAETIKSGPAGRRDPFLSVIRNAPSGPTGPSCSVGKKCLYIPELVVKGIAKDTEGQMMAVVVSNTHRAYFLRENDQVFNGSVEKITSDSVVFREYATDHIGRETAHEVVKRIPKT